MCNKCNNMISKKTKNGDEYSLDIHKQQKTQKINNKKKVKKKTVLNMLRVRDDQMGRKQTYNTQKFIEKK